MSLPNPIWQHVQHLPVEGFNPSPYFTDEATWVFYRKQNGTYAKRISKTLDEPLSEELRLSPVLLDLRVIPGTHPPLAIASIHNRPARQSLLVLYARDDSIGHLTPAHALRLTNGPSDRRPKPQKNWLPFENECGQLVLFYAAAPLTLAVPDAACGAWTLTDRQAWKLPHWAAKLEREVRLSTAPLQLPNAGLFWTWHIKDQDGGYWTGGTISQPHYPYKPAWRTKQPLFRPEDATTVSPHWPPNTCIFPMVATTPTPDRIQIWAGDSDLTSIVASTKTETILKLMEPCQ